jgi:hypothetical protein
MSEEQAAQQRQKLWANDAWLMDKHPFFDNPDAPGRCERCGMPESNAGHPPLTGEAPEHRPRTHDEQMSEALTAMWRLTDGVRMKPRDGWTRQQWVADAQEIMNDIDGSATSLLNGHVMAMLEEIAYMARQRDNAVLRTAKSAQIITAVTPVIAAAQHWLMAQLSVWDSPLEGEALRQTDIFRKSVQTILDLEQAVRDYNVVLVNAKEKERQKVGENV